MNENAPETASIHEKVAPLLALTSLRFFAAVYVLLFHYSAVYFVHQANVERADFFSYGYTGVTFFFVLSGFILSYNYKKTDFGKRENVRSFFLARFARVYPVYLLSLLLAAPILVATVAFHRTDKTIAVLSAILAPLGLQAWVPGAACALNCPSWSVSTEMFFYLLFPFLFSRVLARPARWGVFALIFFVLSSGVMLGVWSTFGNGQSPLSVDWKDGVAIRLASDFVKYFPLARLAEFVAGILLFSFRERYRDHLQPLSALGLALLNGFILWTARPWIPDLLLHNGLTAIFWIPVIWAGAATRGGPLTARPLVFLGKISYALYLLHITVFSVMVLIDKTLLSGQVILGNPTLAIIFATLATIAVSSVVYLGFEERFRRELLIFGPPRKI